MDQRPRIVWIIFWPVTDCHKHYMDGIDSEFLCQIPHKHTYLYIIILVVMLWFRQDVFLQSIPLYLFSWSSKINIVLHIMFFYHLVLWAAYCIAYLCSWYLHLCVDYVDPVLYFTSQITEKYSSSMCWGAQGAYYAVSPDTFVLGPDKKDKIAK